LTYDLAGRLIGVSDTSAAITAAATPSGTLATASMTYDQLTLLSQLAASDFR